MSPVVVLTRIQPLLTDSTAVENIPIIPIIPIIDQNNKKQFYQDATHRLIRKLDRRLVPFLLLLELSSFINLVNIGNAKLMDIQNDLHMSDSEWNWTLSLSYMGYILFALPSNLLLRVIGVTRYLSLSMIAWGSITVGIAFVTNARQMLILRFFLGAVQAGYFPSIVIYFSMWYSKREQTMKIALLNSAAAVSVVVGNILACGMQKMDGMGNLYAWRWMFLFEGLPIIPLGIITYRFLDTVPNAVQWLNNIEKQLLTNLLQNDAGVVNGDLTSTTRISWRQVYYVFIDWRIYLYALIAGGFNPIIICPSMFLTLIGKTMDYSGAVVQLMTALSYVFAFVCCLLIGYSSSRRNEHGYHLAFCLIISLLGFILMLSPFGHGQLVTYIGIIISLSGVFSAFPLILAWLTNNVGGHTKRAMAIGCAMGISRIGGSVMFLIYREADKPTYKRGHLISIGMVTVSLVTTIILRICLMRENHRRTHLSLEEYQREIGVKEPCDWHPDVRYVL